MCEEHETFHDRTGTPGVGGQLSSSFVPSVIKTEVPLDSDDRAHKDLLLQKICKRGRRHKTGAKCAVHKDETCFLCDPTWAQDVCVQRSMSLSCLLNQAVM